MRKRFTPAQRLRKNEEFRRVFNAQCSVSDQTLVVYALRNDSEFSRLGACVSRKNGNAVMRNWWKRRIREAFRLQQDALPQGFDFIVLPRVGANRDGAQIALSLLKLAPQAVKRAKSKS